MPAEEHLDRLDALTGRQTDANGELSALGEMWAELQTLMWDKVGVLRTEVKLMAALARIREMRPELEAITPTNDAEFNLTLQDWYDLRSALLTAESVALAAINRTESRGAHQREDYEEIDPAQSHNQRLQLDRNGSLVSDYLSVGRAA